MDYDIIELSNLFKLSACGRHICPQKFKDNISPVEMVLEQEETQLLAAHTCSKHVESCRSTATGGANANTLVV